MSLFDNFIKRFAIDWSDFSNEEVIQKQKQDKINTEKKEDEDISDALDMINDFYNQNKSDEETNESEENKDKEDNLLPLVNVNISKEIIDNLKKDVEKLKHLTDILKEGKTSNSEISKELESILNDVKSLNLNRSESVDSQQDVLLKKLNEGKKFFDLDGADYYDKAKDSRIFNLPVNILDVAGKLYTLYQYIKSSNPASSVSDTWDTSELYDNFGENVQTATTSSKSKYENDVEEEKNLKDFYNASLYDKLSDISDTDNAIYNVEDDSKIQEKVDKVDLDFQNKLNKLDIQFEFNKLRSELFNIIQSYFTSSQTYDPAYGVIKDRRDDYSGVTKLQDRKDKNTVDVKNKETKDYIDEIPFHKYKTDKTKIQDTIVYDKDSSTVGYDFNILIDKFNDDYVRTIELLSRQDNEFNESYKNFVSNNNFSDDTVIKYLTSEFGKWFQNLDDDKVYILEYKKLQKLNSIIASLSQFIVELRKIYSKVKKRDFKIDVIKEVYDKLCSNDFIKRNIISNLPISTDKIYMKQNKRTNMTSALKIYFAQSFNTSYSKNSNIATYIDDIVEKLSELPENIRDVDYNNIRKIINLTGLVAVIHEFKYFYANKEGLFSKIGATINNENNYKDGIMVSRVFDGLSFDLETIFKKAYNILIPIYNLESKIKSNIQEQKIDDILDYLCNFYKFLTSTTISNNEQKLKECNKYYMTYITRINEINEQEIIDSTEQIVNDIKNKK